MRDKLKPATNGLIDPTREVRRYAAGWPRASFTGTLYVGQAAELNASAIEPPPWLGPSPAPVGFGGSQRAIPLRPEPFGFTLDTLFYAAILAGLFIGPPRIHHFLRLRRGLCPACGYNLSGLPPAAPCPECGKARSP